MREIHAIKRRWLVLTTFVVLSPVLAAKEPTALAASAPPLEVAIAQVTDQQAAIPNELGIIPANFPSATVPAKIVSPVAPKSAPQDINEMQLVAVAQAEAQAVADAQEKQVALERFLAAQAAPKPQAMVVTRPPVVPVEPNESGMPTPEQWEKLRFCESGGNYAIDTGNSFYGAYQFTRGTWRTNAPEGWEEVLPSEAPADVQDQAARTLYERRGRQPWPVCGRFLL